LQKNKLYLCDKDTMINPWLVIHAQTLIN
jgi:hypothetical protein